MCGEPRRFETFCQSFTSPDELLIAAAELSQPYDDRPLDEDIVRPIYGEDAEGFLMALEDTRGQEFEKGWGVIHYLVDAGWRDGIDLYLQFASPTPAEQLRRLTELTKDEYIQTRDVCKGFQLDMANEEGLSALELARGDVDMKALLRSKIDALAAQVGATSQHDESCQATHQTKVTAAVRRRMETRYLGMLESCRQAARELLGDDFRIERLAQYGANAADCAERPGSQEALVTFSLLSPALHAYLDQWGDFGTDVGSFSFQSMDLETYKVKNTGLLYAILGELLSQLGVTSGIWRHSATERHSTTGSGEQADGSILTVNICRQQCEAGGAMIFPQVRETTADGQDAPLRLDERPYTISVYKGWLRHEVSPVSEGQKKNIIVMLS
eukprot:TRINITY_DN3504_c0_g1_i1.p1 TRINITY_DN3504_c0_g1~~TRINITY_DN3504_c0_g1_i1.p1  ORF type:complete len:385 (+),score=74.46 TRINITY_DN3504_c0_g1_i1:97-1251(+)